MRTPTVLVVAKAPEPGLVKTRIARHLGDQAAAEIAAAALLDTLAAATATVGAEHCRLALAGDLDAAVRGREIRAALAGWTVVAQLGDGFADRLAAAHAGCPGPVVQVGMDTPQLTARLLRRVERGLAAYDAVLGPAEDGGWWVLGLRNPSHADALRSVPMSTPHTYAATRRALAARGLRVGVGDRLRDVDHVTDLAPVAEVAPAGHFTTAYRALLAGSRR